jgi:hypothetical protein
VVSAFAEVTRAKHHHDGAVGINVLRKIAMPIPATIYGAMLAGVDVVLAGAGSPDEMPRLLDALARHEEGVLSVKVRRARSGAEHATRFAPAQVAGLPIGAPLGRPRFLAKRFPCTGHCGVGTSHGSPRCSLRLIAVVLRRCAPNARKGRRASALSGRARTTAIARRSGHESPGSSDSSCSSEPALRHPCGRGLRGCCFGE